MASSRRQYITVFAIGGKILSSFKGTMTAARAGMRGLQVRMKAMQASMATAGKSMIGTVTKLTAAFGGLATLLGGLLVGNILSKIFSGAADEAALAEKRTRDLTASLQINAKIHGQAAKFTEAFTKKQIELIYEHNKAIESQGVIAHASLDQFSALMGEMGFAPKVIMATSSAFADLLVKSRGLNANYEDGLELNEAIRKLIEFGQVKAFAKMFPQMVKADQQELKNIHTREDALRFLMRFADEYKGFNKRALSEAGGPLKRFKNLLATIGEDIGKELLPAQDELAKTWTELLPILKPVLKIITDGLVQGIKDFAAWSRKSLTPENTKKFLDALKQVGAVFGWMVRNAKWLVPLIIGLVVAFEALKVALVLVNAAILATNLILAVTPVGWIIIGITALVAVLALSYIYWDKITAAIGNAWEAMKKWPIIGPVLDALQQFWEWMKKIPVLGTVVKFIEDFAKALFKWLLNPIGAVKDLWDALVAVFTGGFWTEVGTEIAGLGGDIMKWLYGPINSATEATHKLLEAWRSRPTWAGGMGASAQSLMVQPPPGALPNPAPNEVAHAYATGGIATKPQVATLAEHGPELVLPLGAMGSNFTEWVTLQENNTKATKQNSKITELLASYFEKFTTLIGVAFGVGPGGGGAGGVAGMAKAIFGGGGGAGAAAAATAPAQAAAAQIPLSPEGLKAVQDERADVMKEMMRPELRNLISATMATEAGGIEDQKNVAEALVNRAVAAKKAGNYKGIEAMIKGGFYGPWNRGETRAMMGKGLTDSRSQQVLGALTDIQQGRNALGGLTDQGMIGEIKGAIKERHGEDYYGMQGLPGEKESAAYKYSQAFREGGQVARAYADGGIASTPQLATLAERGPEMVLPMSQAGSNWGGFGFNRGGDSVLPLDKLMSLKPALRDALTTNVPSMPTQHINFQPNVTIHGGATEEQQKSMDSRLRDLAKDFVRQFKMAQQQERRLSYESGYST
jgi:hypothetical protein